MGKFIRSFCLFLLSSFFIFMKVHLIKSKEVDAEKFTDVVNLLQSVSGPIDFLFQPDAVINFEQDEMFVSFIEGRDRFEKQERHVYFSEVCSSKMEFPLERNEVSWDTLFSKCSKYRKQHRIANDEFVILLTDVANNKNWFACLDEANPYNGFIHTDDWDYFMECPEAFPIAYEVIALILQKHIFNGWIELRTKVHQKAIGCVSDLCMNKQEVMLKMRTADICNSCMQHIEGKLPMPVINHCLQLMNVLRERMLFVANRKSYLQPSKMKIRGKSIFLTDYNNTEIRLRPLELTLYLLFLRHPEGLYMSSLCDHKQELYDAYSLSSGNGSVEEMRQRIDDLANVLSESATQKISRIKRVFEDTIGSDLAQHYIIKGEHGQVKKIAIDRGLVEIG